MYKTSSKHIATQSMYAFVLMLVYIGLYLSTADLQVHTPMQRYRYVFTYFPLFAYYMILFPRCVLIPTQEFFPKLSDRLAIDATIVMSWIGLLFMVVLLLGKKLFYEL